VAALLEGKYLFADSCQGEVMTLTGRTATPLGLKAAPVGSFGEDADGELYVLSLAGTVYRLDGGS
jgi:hypothetical protein